MVLWSAVENASYVDPIFKLQKKAIRTISFHSRLFPSPPIFNDLKFLAFFQTFELRLVTIVYESVKTSPSCFHSLLSFSSSAHQYFTRQASQRDSYMFHKSCVRYSLKSIRYLDAKIWNALPIELKSVPSKIFFKLQLKIYFMNKIKL